MSSERTRNIAVGLTMLATLAVLAVGIFKLGAFASLARGRPYLVKVITPNANGLSPGSKVNLNGVYVGTVANVYLAEGAHRVHILLDIQRDVKIPGNVQVEIGSTNIGAPYIALHVPPGATTQPDLPQDDSAVLENVSTNTGLIPQTVFDTVQDLSKSLQKLSVKLTLVADDLHALMQQRTTAEVDQPNNPDHPLANISTLVQRLDRVARSVDTLVGDPTVQNQMKELVRNLAETSTDLKQIIHEAHALVPGAQTAIAKVGDAGDKIGGAATQAQAMVENANRQIMPLSEKLLDVLGSLQKTLTAISEGKGTAGRFVQDPKLYEGLVDVTNELKGTIDDLHAMIREIRETGLGIHLGGAKSKQPDGK